MSKYSKGNQQNDFHSITDKIDARIEAYEKGTPEPTDLRLTEENLDQFLAALICRNDALYIDKELIETIERIIKIQDVKAYNRNMNAMTKRDFILEIIEFMRSVPSSFKWQRDTFLAKLSARYGGTAKYKELVPQLYSEEYIMTKELAMDIRDTVKDSLQLFSSTYIDVLLKDAFACKLSGEYNNSDDMEKSLTYVLSRAADFKNKIANVSTFNNDKGLLITNKMSEDSIRKVMQKLKDISKPVLTGLKEMNKMIDGFYKRKLYMFAGIPNTGKTTTLGQFTIDCRKFNRAEDLLLNKNKRAVAAYITMEDSEADIANRTVGFMGQQQLRANESSLEDLIESFKEAHLDKNKYNIDVLIKEFPGKSATVDDISAYLSTMEAELECEFVMISIDYVKRIKCKNTRINDEFLQLAEITEDLRNMAVKFNCPVVTAAQLNRIAQQKIVDDLNRNKKDVVKPLSSAEIGNSFAMVENTDTLILINSEFGESGRKYMSFKNAKMRYRPKYQIDYFAAPITPMGGFESDMDLPFITDDVRNSMYRKQFRTVASIEAGDREYMRLNGIKSRYENESTIDFNLNNATTLQIDTGKDDNQLDYGNSDIGTQLPLNTRK